MTHPNAAKGKRWESAVRDFLRPTFGRRVIRPTQEGYRDVGDLHVPLFVLQCKDETWIDLPGYLRAAERQRIHAGERFSAAVVKARGKPAADGYVVMSLATFRDFLDFALSQGDSP